MIVLYSTHCPRCDVLQKKMDLKGLQYIVIDDETEIVDKGFMTIPMLEADGEVMDFGKAIKWIGEQ